MLGPLVNPVMPRHQLLGVYNLKLLRLYHYICQQNGIDCTIVHSLDGYDEVSLTSDVKVASPQGESVYTPGELGFSMHDPSELWGGETVEQAARIFDAVLEGTASPGQSDCVQANAAFAIRTLDPALSWEEARAKARESLESGRAAECFRCFVELNR